MKKLTYILSIFFLFPLALRADTSVLYDAASISGAWLTMPRSAHTLAMADSDLGLSQGIHAVGGNPAGLSTLKEQQIEMTHNAWFQGISSEHAAWGSGFGWGGLALSVDYLNFGQVQGYDRSAQGNLVKAAVLNPNAYRVGVAWGQSLPKEFSYGIAVKAAGESLASQSDLTLGVDIGFRWKAPVEGLALGAALREISGQISGGDAPMNIVVGFSYSLGLGPTELTRRGEKKYVHLRDRLEIDFSTVTSPRALGTAFYALGLEYILAKDYSARLGYKFTDRGALEGLAGLTGGVGWGYKQWSLDYAIATFGKLGTSHQVSLGYHF